MPGFATHYLFGVRTFPRIHEKRIRRLIAREHAAYALGLQGPDVFFYYFPSYIYHPHNIGNIAHNCETGLFFASLLAAAKEYEPESPERFVAEAYVYGFIGHYTLDTTAHPFIYAFTGYDADDPPSDKVYFGKHTYLETEIDNTLLMKFKQVLPSRFYMNRTIALTRLQRKVIGHILASAYNTAYREAIPELKVTEFQTRMGTRWMYVLTRLMHDPLGWKKCLVRWIEQILIGRAMFSPMIPSDTRKFVKDPLNHQRKKWIHPWTKEKSDLTFDELFDRAMEHYLKRISGCSGSFLEQEDDGAFLKEYGNKSFSSGLELRD